MDIKMDLSLIFCLGLLFLPLAKTNQAMLPLLQAMERLTDFYQSDFHNLNVDGLFGLRVLEGHLDLILQKQSSGNLDHLDKDIVSRIRTMKLKASSTADSAIQHVKRDDLEYFKQLSFVVGSPWYIFDEERHQIDPTLVWRRDVYHHAKRTVKFDETVSDNCMAELVGSHKVNGTLCDIGTSCIKTMTSPGLVGYGNTHQLLWTMLGEKAGCKNQIEEKLKEINRGTLVSLRRELCTNNFYQLKETLGKMDNNQVIPAFQDLFLEQLFICPSLGYYEFLHPDFLPQILSWQLPPGCYGKMKRVRNTVKLDPSLKGSFTDDYKDDNDDYDDFDKLLAGIQLKNVAKDGVLVYNNTKGEVIGKPKINKESWEIPSNKGRKLLVEKEMTGGCLAHKTAVASGALVIYLRFMCEPDAAEIFGKARVTRSTDHSDNNPKQVLNSAINNLNLDDKVLDSVKDKTDLNQKHPVVNLGLNADELVNKEELETKSTKKLTFVKPNDMIHGDLPDGIVDLNDNKDVIMKDSKNVNSDLDVENDMSDLNQHLKQLNDPDLHEQKIEFQEFNNDIGNQMELHDKDTVLVDHALNNQVVETNEDAKLDEDREDDVDGDLDDNDPNDGDGLDDEYEDDDENDADDGNVDNNEDVTYNDKYDNKDNEDDDDDYYDERDGDIKPFPKLGDTFGIEQPMDRNDPNEDNDYDDGNDDENDDDYDDDDGYNDNDGNNENDIGGMHPHLNLRNIGRRDYRMNDGGFNNEKNLSPDYRYKNDDDEEDEEDEDVGDDYEYDDENDEMARRREEELRGDVQFEETVKKTKNNNHGAIQKDILRDPETISPSTAFFVFGFCITLVLILMYKFIRKRRIRIRFNPKYFSV